MAKEQNRYRQIGSGLITPEDWTGAPTTPEEREDPSYVPIDRGQLVAPTEWMTAPPPREEPSLPPSYVSTDRGQLIAPEGWARAGSIAEGPPPMQRPENRPFAPVAAGGFVSEGAPLTERIVHFRRDDGELIPLPMADALELEKLRRRRGA